MHRIMHVSLAFLAVTLTSAACGNKKDGGGCPAEGTGTLEVNITASGFTPSVQIWGSGALEDTLTATGSVDLPGGRYQVAADTVATAATGGDLAGTLYAANEPVVEKCVRDGKTTTVDVTYAVHPGSGMLWVAQSGLADNDVVAFAQSKLTAPGSQNADVLLDLASGNPSNNVIGMTFDRWGNLWLAVACACGDRMSVLTPTQLATAGDLDPTHVVLSTALQFVRDITLDPDGNLWASNADSDTVVRFAAGDLIDILVADTVELNADPDITVESPGFNGPAGLEFDDSGNLWVANRGEDEVLGFTAADVAASGTPTATYAVTGDTPPPVVVPLAAPVDLVFQPDGDLWVTYLASNILARYTPAQYGTSGNYEPDPQTAVPVSAIPVGIAVDAQGGVWSAQYEFRLQRTDAADYTVDSTDLGDPQKLTFLPAP